MPVLLNLYFESAELIDNSYGLGVHSYADDMQCRVVNQAGLFGLGSGLGLKLTKFLGFIRA